MSSAVKPSLFSPMAATALRSLVRIMCEETNRRLPDLSRYRLTGRSMGLSSPGISLILLVRRSAACTGQSSLSYLCIPTFSFRSLFFWNSNSTRTKVARGRRGSLWDSIILPKKNVKFRTQRIFVRLLSSFEHVLEYSQERIAKKIAISTASAIAMALGQLERCARQITNFITDIGSAFWCFLEGSCASYPRNNCFNRKHTSPSMSYLGSGSPSDLNPCDTFARVSRTEPQASLLVRLVSKWQSRTKVQKARRSSCFCSLENISRCS